MARTRVGSKRKVETGAKEAARKAEGRASGLVRKIQSLPPEKMAEVEDFVEFLSQREDRLLSQAAGKLTEKALRKVWDNPADSAY
jgi:hypothetical protein